VAYNQEAKEWFHRQAKLVLKALAARLGIPPNDYDLRSNMAGIAVSGEVTLHSDKLYVQFSQSSLGPNQGFMWRMCDGRQDYSGRRNQWMAWDDLIELDEVVKTMQREINLAFKGA
jgi:hypothetical protein